VNTESTTSVVETPDIGATSGGDAFVALLLLPRRRVIGVAPVRFVLLRPRAETPDRSED